jgi:hypothetical protein
LNEATDISGKSLDLHPSTTREALLFGQSYSGVQHLRAIQWQRTFVVEIVQAFADVAGALNSDRRLLALSKGWSAVNVPRTTALALRCRAQIIFAL